MEYLSFSKSGGKTEDINPPVERGKAKLALLILDEKKRKTMLPHVTTQICRYPPQTSKTNSVVPRPSDFARTDPQAFSIALATTNSPSPCPGETWDAR